ncbi:hypothetical protein M011DRAFT_480957 [Sporormia fimetaria CBS 119925]|uniref:Uncharacterized protein n=1 Tax=Sporormia fimetaria CBS 119925 TaxID=1340428 RepID=A0A6A6V063_9PLEO|nr:hypothetical protein M011DRAFT_480957 [Sporormia fimetaria CBS 119925]
MEHKLDNFHDDTVTGFKSPWWPYNSEREFCLAVLNNSEYRLCFHCGEIEWHSWEEYRLCSKGGHSWEEHRPWCMWKKGRYALAGLADEILAFNQAHLRHIMRENNKQQSESVQQLACLQLCEQMQQKLPPELRHMIYDFVHERPAVFAHDDPWYPFKGAKEIFAYYSNYEGWSFEEGYACQFEMRARKRHWDVRFVGWDTLRQLTENFYRTSTFYLYDQNSITNFLHTDHYGVGFEPAGFVLKIVFIGRVDGYRSDLWKWPDKLNCFSGLRAGAKLRVDLVTADEICDDGTAVPDMVGTILELSRKLYSLKIEGVKFSVALRAGNMVYPSSRLNRSFVLSNAEYTSDKVMQVQEFIRKWICIDP